MRSIPILWIKDWIESANLSRLWDKDPDSALLQNERSQSEKGRARQRDRHNPKQEWDIRTFPIIRDNRGVVVDKTASRMAGQTKLGMSPYFGQSGNPLAKLPLLREAFGDHENPFHRDGASCCRSFERFGRSREGSGGGGAIGSGMDAR
jgi:hypothetical protein